MITPLGESKYSLELRRASDPLLSEARVAADAVGMYWDEQTSPSTGEHAVQAMIVRDLYRNGVRNMHDSLLRATTAQENTLITLNEYQLRWLGQAANHLCRQQLTGEAPYDLVAQQIANELSLRIEENLPD